MKSRHILRAAWNVYRCEPATYTRVLHLAFLIFRFGLIVGLISGVMLAQAG